MGTNTGFIFQKSTWDSGVISLAYADTGKFGDRIAA